MHRLVLNSKCQPKERHEKELDNRSSRDTNHANVCTYVRSCRLQRLPPTHVTWLVIAEEVDGRLAGGQRGLCRADALLLCRAGGRHDGLPLGHLS